MNLNWSPVIPYNYANALLKTNCMRNDLVEMLQESERWVCVHMDAGMRKQMDWTLFCGCTNTDTRAHEHTNAHTPGMMSG